MIPGLAVLYFPFCCWGGTQDLVHTGQLYTPPLGWKEPELCMKCVVRQTVLSLASARAENLQVSELLRLNGCLPPMRCLNPCLLLKLQVFLPKLGSGLAGSLFYT